LANIVHLHSQAARQNLTERLKTPSEPEEPPKLDLGDANHQTRLGGSSSFKEDSMPEKQTLEKINKKRGALSDRQAIAVGLSKARQKGGKVPAPGKKDSATSDTRAKSRKDHKAGEMGARKLSTKRPPAKSKELKKLGRASAMRNILI
jgi:hypothetical protein